MTTTLLLGGHIYTPADPFATAMAVLDGLVTWIGTDDAVGAYGGDVETVELNGALVAPAFVDAHVHATSTGLALDGLDLTGCTSLADALRSVERHARQVRPAVVLGHGWDETRWPERRPPSREELDRAAGGAPVYLSRTDVHSAVVSSALLAAVPEVRSEQGFAESGHLRTDAHHAVRRAAFASVSAGQRLTAQRATRARAAAAGIGCLHEMGGPQIAGADDLAGLLALAADEPGPEVVGYWGELMGVEAARELGAHGAAGDLFVDGALGSHTACLSEPYADAPTTGARYLSCDDIRRHVRACTEAGMQAGFHVIGDEATETVVAALLEAAEELGPHRVAASRHRLEHVEMINAEQIAHLAALAVVGSVQPAFDSRWGGAHGMYAKRLGAERACAMNPFASMAAAGVTLAFGSDSPVTPLDPWGAVRAAVHHHQPEQRTTPRAAFTAHTLGGRRAAGQQNVGVLAPGAAASYVIWRTGTAGLPDLSADAATPLCLRTVVRGATVFSREGALE